MRNIICAVIIAFSFLTPVSTDAAATGLDIFDNGLTWNYVVEGTDNLGYHQELYRMKFDGVVEYEGHEYHRYVDDYNTTLSSYIWEFGSSYWHSDHEPILVRVDNGIYFARVSKSLMNSDESGYASEKQLFDFNCEPGDIFQGINEDGEIINVRVIKTEYVNVNGKKLKLMHVDPFASVDDTPEQDNTDSRSDTQSGEIDSAYQVLEGVGIVKGGLYWFFNTKIPAGAPAVKRSGYLRAGYYRLHSLTDPEGNILYPEREQDETYRAMFGYDPYKVWEYSTVQELPVGNVGEKRTRYTLSFYWFDGLERRGNRIYKKLCLKGEKTWTVTERNGVTVCSPIEESEKDECVGLFRQWGGSLYMLPYEKEISYVRYPYSDFNKLQLEEDEDVMLYPIGVKPDSEVDVWFDGFLANVRIGGAVEISDNKSLTEVRIASAGSQGTSPEVGNVGSGILFDKKYVSGVGNTGLGYFWNPKPNDNLSQYERYEPRTFFNNMYGINTNNGKWELLYKGADISPTNPGAVGGIATDNVNTPAAVYDLCGRKVLTGAAEADLRNLPKGIYIYKGRKIII